MKMTMIGLWLLLAAATATGQNWNAYPAAAIGVPYTNGAMIATVTKVNTTMNSGTPMFTTSTSPDCYIAAGSLALNAGFFNSYIANSSRIQVDIDFSNGGAIAGTCNSATFTIKDINSGESFTDFLDVVEISGIDGNNVALPAANITVTPAVQVNVTTVGNSKKIVGHNSSSEVVTGGPYSSTPCNTTSITVTPPANTPLKSIKIIYRPAVGTSSANAYFSVGTHPAVQYISISNLTLTPTGGGCTVLPAGLTAFYADQEPQSNVLHWQVADVELAHNFLVEQSVNGQDFTPMGGAWADLVGNYALRDEAPQAQTFYKLVEVNANGQRGELGVLEVLRPGLHQPLFQLIPNPGQARTAIVPRLAGSNAITVTDATSRELLSTTVEGQDPLLLDCQDWPRGMYWVQCRNGHLLETGILLLNH